MNTLSHLERARRTKSAKTCRGALEAAEHRVADALAMGCPNLAASWRRDVEAIKDVMRARGLLKRNDRN